MKESSLWILRGVGTPILQLLLQFLPLGRIGVQNYEFLLFIFERRSFSRLETKFSLFVSESVGVEKKCLKCHYEVIFVGIGDDGSSRRSVLIRGGCPVSYFKERILDDLTDFWLCITFVGLFRWNLIHWWQRCKWMVDTVTPSDIHPQTVIINYK